MINFYDIYYISYLYSLFYNNIDIANVENSK